MKMQEDKREFQQGQCIRIFIGETQEWQGKSLSRALVEVARRNGANGAFILRGIEGFGPEHHLTTERLIESAENLPLIVDIIVDDEHFERLMPLLDQMVGRGMITAKPITFLS
jgi:PII-like signaling protein